MWYCFKSTLHTPFLWNWSTRISSLLLRHSCSSVRVNIGNLPLLLMPSAISTICSQYLSILINMCHQYWPAWKYRQSASSPLMPSDVSNMLLASPHHQEKPSQNTKYYISISKYTIQNTKYTIQHKKYHHPKYQICQPKYVPLSVLTQASDIPSS